MQSAESAVSARDLRVLTRVGPEGFDWSLPATFPSSHTKTQLMYSYRVFGGCLNSEIPFPELLPAKSARANWTFRLSHASVESRRGELLGMGLEPYCQIELHREGNLLRLFHSCTGEFEISDNGRAITWRPKPEARMEAARADVFGRVLAVAMHLQGVLTLHASAVAFEKGAIAFIAPKHHGKSTLAMALTGAGARLVTDDMLPVRTAASPTVAPGVQSVRLMDDSASRLVQSGMNGTIGVDGKHVIHQSDSHRLLAEEVPLEAIYILSPVDNLDDGAPVARFGLPPTLAAMSLVRHTKVGALLGKFGASAILDGATAVVRDVPVYRLQIVRDIERLNDVVEAICCWHQVPMPVEV